MMIAAIWSLVGLILSFVVSTGWLVQSLLYRSSDMVYLPQAVRYLFAALVYFFAIGVFQRRLPQVSARLFQSALTTGILAHFICTLFLVPALKDLPSGLVGTAFAAVPLLSYPFIYSYASARIPVDGLALVAVTVMFFGVLHTPSARPVTVSVFILMLLALGVYVLTIIIFKKVFWIHSSMDLMLWSFVFVAVLYVGFAWHAQEFSLMRNVNPAYWKYVVYLGIITGLGGYVYGVISFRTGPVGVFLVSLGLSVFPLLIGILAWKETPTNSWLLLGAGVCIFCVLGHALTCKATRSLAHFPHSGVRQGERIVCLLDGHFNYPSGEQRKVQIVDLSINGLGFRSETEVGVNDEPILFLPINYQLSNVHVHVRLVRVNHRGTQDFPWAGGLVFQNLKLDRRQSLVEFLARVAVTET